MESCVGYDYGVKSRVMVVGDVEFPSLMGDKFLALAYAVEPQFGALVDAPMLIMVFESEAAGRECFEHFNSWRETSESGDAVALGFVELGSDDYVMCIYPEHEHLVQRTIPETHRPEVDPLIFTVGYSKTFPRQSGGYDWFKRAAGRSPFIVAPGMPTGSVLTEAAFYKTEVNFYQHDDLPEHSMEAVLMRLREEGEAAEGSYRPDPSEVKVNPREIAKRRCSQLSRFFPVTLERLSFDSSFGQTLERLTREGFKKWQIVQAGCNLALRSYATELFSPEDEGDVESSEELSRADILDYLLGHQEDVMETFPPTNEITASALREQITADSRDLLSYVAGPNVSGSLLGDPQVELSRWGLSEV